MKNIDIGDLSIPCHTSSLQQSLFEEIRTKITQKLWSKGARLPATRTMAEELKVSRNTITLVYERLVAEGYIESRTGSGFYVCVSIPDNFLQQHSTNQPTDQLQVQSDSVANKGFAPGIPDLDSFPYSKWQRIVQHHLSRSSLAGQGELQGLLALRKSLNDYLASSRSVHCHPERIIITNGAQQALTIATLAILQPEDSLIMENPGYSQMTKVLDLLGINIQLTNISANIGLNIDTLVDQPADAIYLTPSNQYPMGTSLNTTQRIQILQWAQKNNSWVIEDDYDSEFQFSHRPYASLQGLAAQSALTNRCIYIGSFSKTMFNGLRIGYMVVPDLLVERCLSIKDALTGSTANHFQAALAEFIDEGHFLRHLRKMRKLYQQKHTIIMQSLTKYFPEHVEVVSQPAGLHVTIRWRGLPLEEHVSNEAKKEGIIVRPLSYYEYKKTDRDWQSIVLGYGNTPKDDIDLLIYKLFVIFQRDQQ